MEFYDLMEGYDELNVYTFVKYFTEDMQTHCVHKTTQNLRETEKLCRSFIVSLLFILGRRETWCCSF